VEEAEEEFIQDPPTGPRPLPGDQLSPSLSLVKRPWWLTAQSSTAAGEPLLFEACLASDMGSIETRPCGLGFGFVKIRFPAESAIPKVSRSH
jgi:hypothetical protein